MQKFEEVKDENKKERAQILDKIEQAREKGESAMKEVVKYVPEDSKFPHFWTSV